MRKLLFFILLLLPFGALAHEADSLALEVSADTLVAERPLRERDIRADSLTLARDEHFKWTTLIAPSVMLGLGFTGVYAPWWKENINIPVREWTASWRGDHRFHADDYVQYLPAATNVLLGFAVPHERPFRERVAVTATASITLVILSRTLKYTVGEKRPSSDSRTSFPSGHTATAFMGAELMRREYGPWWGLGAYAVATTVAFLRVYNDRHWVNDLLGGAAIGILSANVGYWMLPLERRLFGWDKPSSSGITAAVVLPYYCNNNFGVSLAVLF